MSALNALADDVQAVIREVLRRRDENLLHALDRADEPTREDREQVLDRLASEFDEHVSGPDWEPTEYGKAVDDALGRFLLRFPIERLEQTSRSDSET